MPYNWVSCKHYMPIPGVDVIACHGHGKAISNACVDDDRHWHFSLDHAFVNTPVTHWTNYLDKSEATPVLKTLPPIGHPVVAYLGDNHKAVIKRNNNGRWATLDDATEYIHLPVTHWAELPKWMGDIHL